MSRKLVVFKDNLWGLLSWFFFAVSRGYFIAVLGLLIAVASLVAEHRL